MIGTSPLLKAKPMITAADYSDWAHYAGLYLNHVSHADRYRTYQPKISDAGLITVILHDFLEGQRGGIDLETWRRSDVYEVGADSQWRIEQTARALEAIGAVRTAAKARIVENSPLGSFFDKAGAGNIEELMKEMQDLDPMALMEQLRGDIARMMPDLAAEAGLPSPEAKPVPVDPDVESREQIEHLFEQWLQEHQDDLSADIARHGDPRQEPGFSPEAREQELEELGRREAMREHQVEEAEAIQQQLDEMEQLLAKAPNTPLRKLRKSRRKVLDGISRFSRLPADELIPAMSQCLERAQRFVESHPAVFAPHPIDNSELLERLRELGDYDIEIDDSSVTVSWRRPTGIACDWTSFYLEVVFPPEDEDSLRSALEMVDRLRAQWDLHQAQLRRDVLEHAENYVDQMDDWELEEYELGEDGLPTEASLLANCGGGQIRIHQGPDAELYGEDGINIFFGVEWDEEHGFETCIVDDASSS